MAYNLTLSTKDNEVHVFGGFPLPAQDNLRLLSGPLRPHMIPFAEFKFPSLGLGNINFWKMTDDA